MSLTDTLHARFSEEAVLLQKASNVAGDLAVNLVLAVLILMATLWLSGQASNLVRRAIKRLPRTAHDATLQDFAGSVVRYVVVIVGVIAILRRLGVETTSIITVLGAASLAIGLALQGALTNVAAGVMILVFRPYRVGDFVLIAGRQGTVQHFDLFNTLLSDPDGLRVMVPNGKAFGDVVTNYTDIPRRRIMLQFGVGYDDDLDRAVATVLEVVAADGRVLADPAPWCKPTALEAYSVTVELRCWAAMDVYWDVRWTLLKAVKQRFDAVGLSFPFPTQTSLTPDLHDDAPAAPPARRAAALSA